ncbi:hypothetical protein VNO78_31536 [Psophocarpus tetragonolobus]|uniref:Uncharacterized protein n=1 Tax=Psophocarpus tetragonolobus TaxID=3891 RepID=A0AAN9RYD6_PSOTE
MVQAGMHDNTREERKINETQVGGSSLVLLQFILIPTRRVDSVRVGVDSLRFFILADLKEKQLRVHHNEGIDFGWRVWNKAEATDTQFP